MCGGHERVISMAGLRSALPRNIELIPGPGCPVCVCPEETIYEAIRIARQGEALVAAFGDMLRVPVNAPRGEPRSLEEAKAAGADVRPVASPRDAVKLARERAGRPVVFFAAGFETTMAPVAAMLGEGVPGNLSLLLAGRLTWPAVSLLLQSERPGFDALIAPGHVSAVMGSDEWRFVPEQHGIPAAIAGFTPETMLAALYSVLRQLIEERSFLDNCYGGVVRARGNEEARRQIGLALRVVDAPWRGIGNIPASGLELAPCHAAHDAMLRFPPIDGAARKRCGEMPPGCGCARVVLGKIAPDQCPLYARACTPRKPVGPCMVSEEGACRIWWSAGVREVRACASEPAQVHG